jgi:DNA polymerase III subunit beta
MTLAIDPKILAGAHSALRGIPDRANGIPVAGMFLLTPGDGGMEITATDCDLELSLTIEASADFAPVCLPPFLMEAAGALGAKEVKMTVDDRTAAFSAGRARFAGQILPGSDFPRFRPNFTTAANIPGKDLVSILSACIGAVSPRGQDDRFYLEGVFLDTLDGRLCAVGTNGYRFQTVSIPAPDGLSLPDGIIIGAKAAKEMIAIADKAGENTVRLEASDHAVAVSTVRERIVSKLIENRYPPYRKVIPAPSGVAATFDVAEMIAALSRVLKIQDASVENAKAKSKSGTAVRIRPVEDSITIEAAAFGDAVDAVRCEFEGDMPTFGLSGKYLHATLSAMKDRGADTVRMDVAETGHPIRLENPADEDFLAIVMPMRV